MNTALILIIGVPLIEIYLFIKIGSQIGAFNTVLLILVTAVLGVAYARYEGFNTIKSGMSQLIKNQLPVYELFSGATLAFAALLLIIPGFATDLIGLLLIIPFTRQIILNKFIKRKDYKKRNDTNYIDGDYEDLSDDNDKKIWNNNKIYQRSISRNT